MPTLRVLLAPIAGVLLASRLAGLLDRQSLVVTSPLLTDELRRVLCNHTIVHIGGQHRGGTTLLLEGVSTHPSISVHELRATAAEAVKQERARRGEPVDGEHAEAMLADADARANLLSTKLHSEGIFLQDVYPKTSLDHQPRFFVRRRVARIACAAWPGLERLLLLLVPLTRAETLLASPQPQTGRPTTPRERADGRVQ